MTNLAQESIRSQLIEYKDGDLLLEGFVAYDDGFAGKRPGVLLVHDWMGLGSFAKKRAESLAKLGYVAFAADIYGKGVRPKDAKEAAAVSGKYKGDRKLLRSRINAAFNTLKQQKETDTNRIAAIGFCFGGTTVLELARSGAPVLGTVSFHGGLDTPSPSDAKNIQGKVLVLHGADDPFVPTEQVVDFWKEMQGGRVDWQLVTYPATVHSFTNPQAGSDNSKGQAYNANADQKSWTAMQVFFSEIFAKKPSLS